PARRRQDERALPGRRHDRLRRHDLPAGVHDRQPQRRWVLRLRRLVPLSGTRARRGGLVTAALLAALMSLAACGTENPGGSTGDSSLDPTATETSEAEGGADCAPGDALPEASGEVGDTPTFTWPETCAP